MGIHAGSPLRHKLIWGSSLIAGVLVASIVASFSFDRGAKETQLPHIIFIIMDDLGSHDLGLHGSGIETPFCDQLAREGLYLDNYYVLPTCSPTRGALLSGKYPLHTGLHTVIHPQSTRGLPLEEETLPQVLKKAGYQTHAVGKWHVGHSRWEQTPTFRGFDSFFGYYLGGQDYYTHKQYSRYDLHWDSRPNCGADCSVVVNETDYYSTHVYTREAIARIQEHKQQHGNHIPLFLYLSYQAVHFPNEVPSEYSDRYKNRTDWTKTRQVYGGMLTAADEGVGNVTEALKQTGLWDNTLIVFTTDNGGPTEVCAVQGSSNYPLRGGKCTVWEGGTTGDGFLSGPYLQRLRITQHRYKGLFHVVDWLPTLGEIAGGVYKSAAIDGVSQLKGLVSGEKMRKEIFVGYGFDQKNWYGPAVRVHHWKLIEGSGGPDNRTTTGESKRQLVTGTYQLYNLQLDKEEQNNVASEFPEVVQELRELLERYKSEYVPEEDEDASCPFREQKKAGFGPTWLPWCSRKTTRQLVVYE